MGYLSREGDRHCIWWGCLVRSRLPWGGIWSRKDCPIPNSSREGTIWKRTVVVNWQLGLVAVGLRLPEPKPVHTSRPRAVLVPNLHFGSSKILVLCSDLGGCWSCRLRWFGRLWGSYHNQAQCAGFHALRPMKIDCTGFCCDS